LTNYKVVDGIASTPKGQQLYDQAIAQQNANRLTNLEHQSTTKKIAGVSNRPTTKGRAFQWYATKDDLINIRGFPVVDGQPIPVTKAHLTQQGYADSPDYRAYNTNDPRKGNYYNFYKYSENIYRYTSEWVIEKQQVYSNVTGEITWKWGKDKRKAPRAKGSAYYISTIPVWQNDWIKDKDGIPLHPKPEEAIPIPPPEPEIIPESKTDKYPIAIIMGILAVVIIIILRGKKNA
tara:strand:- start:1300 stop:2001 length:702 start_codon:yes stop_codon:yes gene_type:complete